MKVTHLLAGVMHAPVMPRIVSRVLLVEHPGGLLLVDAGFSRADLTNPRRLGIARHLLRPDRDPRYSIHGALSEIGVDPAEISDVVVTHLDIDHIGGLADLPQARVHTTADEWNAAAIDTHLRERTRYRPVQWTGREGDVVTHPGAGEPWREGLTGHEVVPGVILLPLPGHSRGHAAVAVETPEGTVVHAGDAVFDASCVQAGLAPIRRFRAFERVIAASPRQVPANHAALARLNAVGDIRVVNAHDARLSFA